MPHWLRVIAEWNPVSSLAQAMRELWGNGGPAPFGNPSPFTVCVLGGGSVKYSNITVTIGTPASNHFGTQAIHGVVLWCTGRFLRPSGDCNLEE